MQYSLNCQTDFRSKQQIYKILYQKKTNHGRNIGKECAMNNEEKILQMLTKLVDAVNQQGETLARHEELLVKQGETLDKHGGQLAEMKEDICELRETAVRVAITQENIVLPRLDTLADGHKHLLKTLASDSRVEALEEDVSTLKSAFKLMSNRLAALEKAQ